MPGLLQILSFLGRFQLPIYKFSGTPNSSLYADTKNASTELFQFDHDAVCIFYTLLSW